MTAVPASPERVLRYFIFCFNENLGLSSFNNSAHDHWEPVPSPFAAPSRCPRSLLPSHVRGCSRRRGSSLKSREGRDGNTGAPGSPRQSRQPPPCRPRRGPAALPVSSRGRGGKVSLQILLGRASGHSPPPRKSVACSLPWEPGVERRKRMAEVPGGRSTCSLRARRSLCRLSL